MKIKLPKIDRQILHLAIPNIISNLSVPLLGMVDMFIVGHLESENYIGAIALAVMLFNFIYWSFSFLRMGTSGFTAQAYGASNYSQQITIFFRSFIIGITIGFGILLFQKYIGQLGFYFLNAEQDIKKYAQEYFFIYIWAAPAVLGLYAFNGWFIGMQDSKTPMWITIFINAINILLNLLLVYQLGLKIKGMAWSTLMAQYFGLLLFIIIGIKKYKHLFSYIDLKSLKKIGSYIPFFKVNRDIFIRTLALIVVSTFFMAASAKEGNEILAVNALLMQLFILFSYFMDGFAYAAEALTGKFIGAGEWSSLNKSIKRLFIWGIIIVLCFSLVYSFSFANILSLLTDKKNIINLSYQYHIWVILIPIAGFSAFLWDGIFIGATASRPMRNSMLLATIAFFISYYSLLKYKNNHILWFSFLLYLSLRGIIQYFMSKSVLKQYKN